MAPDDTTWPLWRRTALAEAPSPADYAELARYVSAEALRGLNFRPPPAGLTDREVAEQVYGDLAEMRICHVVEAARSGPVRSGPAQQIRTPRDVQLTGAATTLDACMMFAAIVRNADLAPVLAIGRDLERDDVRVIVLVVLDRDDSIGSTVPRYTGIATADSLTAARIATGSLIAIDIAAALTYKHHPEPEPFSAARAHGDAFVRSMIAWGEPLHLVNVRARERLADHRPHTPRPDPTFLPMSLPPHAGHAALFAEQRRAVDELRRGSGTMVLLGPAGSGKTTAALHLASEHVEGPAWFLDASSPDSLVSSLADIASREDGRSIDRLDNLDRQGYAVALLARANQSTNPWCIVLDNADEAPAAILPLLPRPSSDGQTVVITTTNPAWLDVPARAHVTLGSIGDAEAERTLADHEDLVGLVGGRVLVLEAYARYLAAGHAADRLLRHGDEATGEQRGVVALVGAILDARPDVRDELGRLSLLPANHLPRGRRDDDLAAYGLVDLDPVTGTPRMHRLIATGIHRVLGESDLSRVALRMMVDEQDWKALSVAADPGLLNIIGALLLEHPSTDDGLALAAASHLMELRGRIQLSQRLAQEAAIALDGPEEGLPVEYADAMQGLARYVNQHRTESRDAIETAMDQVRLAQRIATRHDDRDRMGRARRLEALLRIKRAKLEPDPGERVSAIRDALAELKSAAEDAMREADPAEATRALFNVAGPYVELAQLVPHDADEFLHEAARVYERVRDRRLGLYRQQLHPHIAACLAGLALVRYLEALLVPRTLPERQALLAEASRYGTQALDDRFSLDGPFGGADTGKSARLLTKVAYARHLLNESHPSGDVLAEAVRETAAPRLTADVPPLEFIERWCGSPALADLLRQPGPAGSLDATLFRARALIDEGNDDAEPRTVLVAARHLGLMDVELPARRTFSVALVIGLDNVGLSSSWTALRQHLADGRLAADRLIAAGCGEARNLGPADAGAEIVVVEGTSPFEQAARIVADFAPDEHVLLVTRDLHRLRALAGLRGALPTHRVEALGVRAEKPTPVEYRREIGAVAAELEAWWQTGR